MSPLNWQLETPIDSVIFDCDGTLSTIEGIDELARKNNIGNLVESLTADAMGKTGLNQSLYEKRLNLVKPTKQQVAELGNDYASNLVPDIKTVISILYKLKKEIYIISAGLLPSVVSLGTSLNIPRENIFAVDITFDDAGNYLDFDKSSPLCNRDGKREIIAQLKDKHKNIAFVGDGLNDLAAYDLVLRFVGFGGFYYRKNIAERCKYYITVPSMSPLLPLVLTHNEYEKLNPKEKELYQKGMEGLMKMQ
jgi:phosphoserine phosphatase